MIETVKLVNFKGHQFTELNLDQSRLHALVGQNSSGKTSILQGLYYLTRLVDAPFKSVFDHQNSPDFITTIGQNEVSVAVNGFWSHEKPVKWEAGYQFKKQESQWQPQGFWKIDQYSVDIVGWLDSFGSAASALDSFGTSKSPILQALRFSVYLKLVATNLAKADYSEAVTPRIEFDGSGLAPTLDYLRDETPDQFQNLQEMLQKVVPSVQRIGIRRAKVLVNRQRLIEVNGQSIPYEERQEIAGQEVVLDMHTGERIPAHAISEGTILTLGLLTVLMNPRKPNLVLLDDIEQGLHPKAQRELMAVFKQVIKDNPNLQIIFSTHSPYIVDELTPSQVHVLSNRQSGFTNCKRLDEHPDVEWAQQTLTTGEFWDAEGEDWIMGAVNG